jgi:NAD+ synthase
VGLSGGIDSALSTALAVRAVGKEKVLAVLMPYRTSSEASVEDARTLVSQLDIDHRIVEITPMVDAYFGKTEEADRIRAGNKMARERMSILFDIAHEKSALVLGTGNRTESCLGYTTLYGDSACSINPIGELYKTEVRLLAAELDIPRAIIDKAPSADLWTDQTDEGEIGVTYEQIDRILQLIVDDGIVSMAALEKQGLEATDVSRVVSMMNRNAFKRELPPVAPLDRRPVPNDVILEE